MFRVIYLLTICFSLLKHGSAQQYGSFKDPRDGKVYKTVKIGSQEWMAENLNVDRFQNGDLIPEARTDEEWKEALKNKQPAWCYFQNTDDVVEIYGKLYNFYAVYDSRGLAPIGWKIPSPKNWHQLADNLGGIEIAATKLKNTSGWRDNGYGTNSSGFSALPGGYRSIYGRSFEGAGGSAQWWSMQTDMDISGVPSLNNTSIVWWNRINSDLGLNVRCIKETNDFACELFDDGKYRMAKMSVESGHDFDYYFNKAWEFVRSFGEKSYLAIAHFEEAIRLNPNKGGVYSDLGNCYRGGFKCYKQAEDCYTKAIENGFVKGFVYYNRAVCRYELKDRSGMQSDLTDAAANGWPHDPSNLKGQ
ncbi:MAG: hypothetical protein RL335_45 [Bacteroidota bacterium]|jgi:uncharacterized protein (TIGR02145 family)